MKIAVVNTYFPPHQAITGRAAADLANFLKSAVPEPEVRFFTSRSTSGERLDFRKDTVEIGSPAAARRGKVQRLVASVILGRRLARAAVAWADVIISLTDPPLLGIWIGKERARARKRVLWLEWNMDIYPQAFVAAGLVNETNAIYRRVARAASRNISDCFICLGPHQATALNWMRETNVPTIVLPCGIPDADVAVGYRPNWRMNENRVVIAYAGNLGEAHSAEFLPSIVSAADPKKFAFVFALEGIHSAAIKLQLAGRENVTFRDHMSHAELIHADVHASCLLPHWTHIAVPSKAVSSICLGRPIVFAGNLDSDIAHALGDAAWALRLDGTVNLESELRNILNDIAEPSKLAAKTRAAKQLAENLRKTKAGAYVEIREFIQQSAPGGAH